MPTVKDIQVKQPSEQQIQQAKQWPTWGCEISEFEWEYTQTEKCLILEGKVTITDDPAGQDSVSFGPGDYVILPNGLKCIWKVSEAVKKHYDFD